MKRKALAGVVAALAVALSAPAAAFAGPWAGSSGHFHPQSQPCDNDNDHKKCPGKH